MKADLEITRKVAAQTLAEYEQWRKHPDAFDPHTGVGGQVYEHLGALRATLEILLERSGGENA